jgi:hypothetical protein
MQLRNILATTDRRYFYGREGSVGILTGNEKQAGGEGASPPVAGVNDSV